MKRILLLVLPFVLSVSGCAWSWEDEESMFVVLVLFYVVFLGFNFARDWVSERIPSTESAWGTVRRNALAILLMPLFGIVGVALLLVGQMFMIYSLIILSLLYCVYYLLSKLFTGKAPPPAALRGDNHDDR